MEDITLSRRHVKVGVPVRQPSGEMSVRLVDIWI